MASLTTRRGYGTAHQRERKRWAQIVSEGGAACARCGGPIMPGSRWHLDHADGDRGRYIGVSHAYCNTTAPNRRRRRALPPVGERVSPPAREW
jgi:hypothetical protein